MFWGNGFKYASFIASWVTPHDRNVESVLSRAKAVHCWTVACRDTKTGRPLRSRSRKPIVKPAPSLTLCSVSGLSYVKSSATLGDHKGVSERVRMPRVSLAQSSANCIDAAVMYASLFENLGMDASIVIVPGHAYAGVRVAEGSPKFLLIDVALTGRSTFEAAVASAQNGHGQPCSFRGDAGHGGKSPFFRHLSHALSFSNPALGFSSSISCYMALPRRAEALDIRSDRLKIPAYSRTGIGRSAPWSEYEFNPEPIYFETASRTNTYGETLQASPRACSCARRRR